MAKSDAPALRMIVERGPKLVPATPFDAERLDSYRLGTVIRVEPVLGADRKDVRKWWAILRRAVRDCNTPWRTAQQASEAIKLALGLVEYGKTVNGNFMQWPKSLNDLDDQELAEAVEEMAQLLYRITGVDPMEWPQETPDTGEDLTDSADAHPSSQSAEGSGDEDAPLRPTPTSPEAAGLPADSEGDEEPALSANPEIARALMRDCINDMLRDAFSMPEEKQAEKVEKLREIYLEPQNLGNHAAFVNRCADTVLRIIGKPNEQDRARAYLEAKIQ